LDFKILHTITVRIIQ